MRDAAKEFVRRHADRGVLILATDRAPADELAQEVCADVLTGVLTGVDRFGFRDFVRKLAREELRRAGVVAVGRLVREAIAARVVHATPLTNLAPVARFPGFPRALTDTFEHVQLNRREPDGDLA